MQGNSAEIAIGKMVIFKGMLYKVTDSFLEGNQNLYRLIQLCPIPEEKASPVFVPKNSNDIKEVSPEEQNIFQELLWRLEMKEKQVNQNQRRPIPYLPCDRRVTLD